MIYPIAVLMGAKAKELKMTKTCVLLAVLAIALFSMSGAALANVVTVYTDSNSIQDDWTISGVYDELGPQPTFPADEAMGVGEYESAVDDNIVCPTDYLGGTNMTVYVTNLTSQSYTDVYYVADPETNLTNWDELVGNAGLGDAKKAFKIDKVGENQPLLTESISADGIWQPNEAWAFVIQDYSNTLNLAPNLFGSLGIASLSSGDSVSSGSILVPEPATLSLLALGGLAVLIRRRK